MTAIVWELEWRIATARKRLFVLNVVVPLLLVVPVAAGAAPAVHAAAVYAVLFAIFSTFGSAIPLVRDGESGLSGRVLRAGVAPASYFLQRTAAGAVLDVLQLGPALAVAAVGAGAGPRAFLLVLVVLAATVWVANLLGVLVAAATRSLAEAALFAAVSTLLLLHASGVFRTPVPESFGAALESVAPFRMLHEALLSVSLTTPVRGGPALGVWCVVMTVATWVLAGRLSGSLRVSRRS
jgi:hypothetical protein